MKRITLILLALIVLCPWLSHADTIMDHGTDTPLLTDQVWAIDDPGGTPDDSRFVLQAIADLFWTDLAAGDIPDLSATYQPLLTNPIVAADVDDTPVNGQTAVPVSSNWAYDHGAAADPHTGYQLESGMSSYQTTLTNEAGLYSALSDVSQFYEAGDTIQTNSGTSLPGTCTVGEMFLDTDADTNGSLYTCIASDTWKEVDDDGGAGGGGDLLADGTVPLTANWDVGAYYIQGTQFRSDIATGTAPFVVSSTTEVANLRSATASNLTGTPNVTVGTITAGAAGFSVDADGDVVAKSVSIAQGTSASYSRYYEASGDGGNYHDVQAQAFAANRTSTLPDYNIGYLASDKVDSGGDLADDSVDSEHYVAGSIDNEHLADSAVDTAELAADAVEGTKIADDQVDSEHYAAGSIDNEHLADDAVGMDELDEDDDFNDLTGDWKTTGSISGQALVVPDTSGAITLTVNAVNYGTDTGDADIPDGACDAAADVGNWVVLISSAADQYSLTSNDASNQFVITANAAALTAGDELDVDGTMVCVMCVAAELWKVTGYMGDIPTDGGVAD